MSYWSKHNEWEKVEFINEEKIFKFLEEGKKFSKLKTEEVIEKAIQGKGISLENIACLFYVDNKKLLDKMFNAANIVKQRIYGKRIVLFAPLYISDFCVNRCSYCGYSMINNIKRCKLTQMEIQEEIKVLQNMGHKRLALEAGEDYERCDIDYIIESLDTIYSTNGQKGDILRCNVNIAGTTVENYKKLKKAQIGTYILFQETYHKLTYEKVHKSGPKSDFNWHTAAHNRAMTAGIDDVGFGILFGLYDWRYELAAMFFHIQYLEKIFGVGPHTISVPRLKKAEGMNLDEYPYLVNDIDFEKIIAILRLAVPYTGIILSTRETAVFRTKLLQRGISQISAGSCAGVGGYSTKKYNGKTQFNIEDHRTLVEIVLELLEQGWLPSFCTACYRAGRTGDRFMELAKSGEIQNVCQPNAILTLKEFLNDCATDELKKAGEKFIEKYISEIKDKQMLSKLKNELVKINFGTRNLYF